MADCLTGSSDDFVREITHGAAVADARLAVKLCGVILKNPIMPASGVFGFGMEYLDFYNPNILGAVVLKGTTREPRIGNPLPRVAECEAGLINSVGLQNPGIDALIADELPRLKKICRAPIVANISGFSVEEYIYCCKKIADMVDIIEVNVSCPNVHGGGMSFGASAKSAGEVAAAVKSTLLTNGIKTPVFIKLSPNVTDIVSIAKACEDSGADGLTLINTMLGMRIDLRSKKPVIAYKSGGYSGRGIFPIALRMVYDCARAVNIPIIGAGGVSRAEDVLEMMLAGASAVQIGAENLKNPLCMPEIIESLPQIMDIYDINSLVDIIGEAE